MSALSPRRLNLETLARNAPGDKRRDAKRGPHAAPRASSSRAVGQRETRMPSPTAAATWPSEPRDNSRGP